MEYRIVRSSSPVDLSTTVTILIKQGWEISGSHQVVIKHQENRYRGNQHIDTINELEYSQTLFRKNPPSLDNSENIS